MACLRALESDKRQLLGVASRNDCDTVLLVDPLCLNGLLFENSTVSCEPGVTWCGLKIDMASSMVRLYHHEAYWCTLSPFRRHLS